MKLLLAVVIAISIYALVRVLRQVQRAQSAPGDRPRAQPSLMDVKQARDILGVASDATDEEIIEAHRRLMQKVHPDKGGSAFLAQQLNEAKRALLRK